MTRLVLYAENNMQAPIRVYQGHKEITTALAEIGVLVRHLDIDLPEPESSFSDSRVLHLLDKQIAEVKSLFRLGNADLIQWQTDLGRAALYRQMSLSEHVHEEIEARIVVCGNCLYYLHACGRVAVLLCQAGDQVVIPKGIPHWFDMGPEPDCAYVRIYQNLDNSYACFTGNSIAEQTPRWEGLMQQGIFKAPHLSIVES